MTHEELEAIRLRACGPPEDRGYDVSPLLDYIDELHGVVHDLRQEPGWELGRQEERRDVLALLQRLAAEWDRPYATYLTTMYAAMEQIGGRGPVAPHLAPDDLRRENEALRQTIADLCCPVPRSTGV